MAAGVLPTETKNQVLEAIATALLDHQADILTANQHDVERTSELVAARCPVQALA